MNRMETSAGALEDKPILSYVVSPQGEAGFLDHTELLAPIHVRSDVSSRTILSISFQWIFIWSPYARLAIVQQYFKHPIRTTPPIYMS
jgi:hypothetical protein